MSSQPLVRRTYFPELDGVRAFAIFLVMVFHMAQQGISIPGPVSIGQTGVDLFFVLSGFLITGILLKSSQGDWHEVRTFYIRRTLRIFPLYYVFLLILNLSGNHVSNVFWFYIQNIFFAAGIPIHGPNHFWSLAVEEQFYLAWPFIVLFLPRRYLLTALSLMIAVALLCRVPLLYWNISPFYFTLSRIDALSAGALLAYLYSRGRLFQLRKPMAVLFLLAVVLTAIQGAIANHHPSVYWIQLTKATVLAAVYSTGIGLLLTGTPNLLTRFLASAPLRFVGRISYGLYVFHPIVFQIVFTHFARQPSLIRAALGVLATFACTLISWYGMERHLIGLKDKLAPERARFAPSAPSMTAL